MQDNTAVLSVIVCLVLVGLIYRVLRPIIKGTKGELRVRILLSFLNKQEYRVLHNVRLYGPDYKAQIDHVVISRFGIFVIETKNYTGWILGGEKKRYWTQVIYHRKEQFYNPIFQNYGHIRALKKHLSAYPYLRYFPIVVFMPKATIKIRTSADVIYSYLLLRTIKNYDKVILSEAKKNEIFEVLKSRNGEKRYKSVGTVEQVQTERPIEDCPLCGSTLVLRSSRHGEFFGCKGYPMCRYTRAR